MDDQPLKGANVIKSGDEWSNGMQSGVGADSLDTVATWWQEVFTFGSPLKDESGLKVRQAKTTDILLPNIRNVYRFSFLEDTYLDGQATPIRGCSARVTKNHIKKIQFSFKYTWFQGSKPIIKRARAQNGHRGSIVSLQHHRDLKGLTYH